MGLTLIYFGVWNRYTPRDIYVCTEYNRIQSFIIWLLELLLCPIIIISYGIVSIVRYHKWKKEYKDKYKGGWF